MRRRNNQENVTDLMEFFGLTRREAERAELLLTEVRLRAGDVIAAEGGPGNQLIVLVDAEAEVSRDGNVLKTIGRGETSGEISITGLARRMTADVKVTKSGKALAAGRGDVARLDRKKGLYPKLLAIAATNTDAVAD